MKKPHPFPRIPSIPRGCVVKGVANLGVEKQERYDLRPDAEGGKTVEHPRPWGKKSRTAAGSDQ